MIFVWNSQSAIFDADKISILEVVVGQDEVGQGDIQMKDEKVKVVKE